mmetsp:Transcript_74328/g.198553  ORF Transcript_74328/g.198553 Transcript_74328/m.198553 type:complete len:220 (-) Transcript_74328:652-1311(-)
MDRCMLGTAVSVSVELEESYSATEECWSLPTMGRAMYCAHPSPVHTWNMVKSERLNVPYPMGSLSRKRCAETTAAMEVAKKRITSVDETGTSAWRRALMTIWQEARERKALPTSKMRTTRTILKYLALSVGRKKPLSWNSSVARRNQLDACCTKGSPITVVQCPSMLRMSSKQKKRRRTMSIPLKNLARLLDEPTRYSASNTVARKSHRMAHAMTQRTV